MIRKIGIIGLGSAGFAALMSVRRYDPKAEAVIVDPKPYDLHHPCGIPYALEGVVPDEGLAQDVALKRMGAVKIQAHAESIDWKKKSIIARDGNNTIEIDYDAAIIATGYRANIPPVKNIRTFLGKGVYTLAVPDDVKAVAAELKTAHSALVVGGGAIGLEAAIALKKHTARVTLLEMKNQLLPGVLDADMAHQAETYLASRGIDCMLSSSVDEIVGDSSFKGVRAGNNFIEAEFCILAAGFAPNVDIAQKSGIHTEKFGISVDGILHTSANDVFAAGDCIASWSIINGQKIPVKLATSAYKQGTIAGANACGQNFEYRGTAGTFVTKLAELEIAGTGFTTEAALQAGFDPVSGKISSRVLPDYFPGDRTVSLKLVADKNSGKILGAQALGDGAAWRVNIIGMAIAHGILLEALPSLELAYCPAVSEVYDPLLRVIDFTLRRMKH